MDFGKLIAEGERLLRAGQAGAIPALMGGLNKIPRAARLPLANIHRRASLFSSGLRLLTPVMALEDATAAEKSEYAVLLMKVGSIPEAIAKLSALDARQFPEVNLHLAFCHMNQWNYAEAIPLLREFLDSRPEPYRALVTQVNLAAALVHAGREDEAASIIEAGLATCEREGHIRLLANWRELRAQVLLAAGRDGECAREVALGLDLIGGQGTNDQLYLLKWRAVLESRRAMSATPLRVFREEALRRRDFESVREADFQILKLEYSEELFDRLLFGTPWEGFRRRLESLAPGPRSESFGWGESGGPEFDLTSKTFGDGSEADCGTKVHQVLIALMSDLYAPARVGALFARLFPDEHYHYLHSPNRVHQLLWRTRGWIKSEKLPLKISEVDGRFQMEANAPVVIRIPLRFRLVSNTDLRLQKLSAECPGGFSSVQAQSALGASEPTVRRLIQIGLRAGKLQKIRRGSRIHYKFAGIPA